MQLNGAVAIITGASRGLGVFIAERLARKGMKLALAARSADDLAATAERLEPLGTQTIAVATDVTKRADLRRLVKRTNDELGPVDVLVNNAAIEKLARFPTIELDDIDAIIKTNVVALEVLTRLVVPSMIERRRGHIVNIASMAGKVSVPYNAVYASSKHAVVGFSWSLREELKPFGIGVSAVCPTFVSEAGMYVQWAEERPPRATSTVTPDDVADATVKAIEKNRAEILVVPGLGKVADVLHAISPDLAAFGARRFGLYDFLARGAGKQRSS